MEQNTNIETAISDTIQPEESDTKQPDSSNPQDTPDSLPATANQTEPFLEIKYLKQVKALTKEQAKELAEKGMHYSVIKDRLDYLAANANTTPKQFLDSLIKENDLKIEQKITDALGEGELSKTLTELYKNNIRQQFEQNEAQKSQNEQSVAHLRIADEFLKMQADFGDEIKSVSDIPEKVLAAASEGMPLAYAYLLNKYLTEKNAAKKEQADQKAAQSALGSVSTDSADDPIGELFVKSLWGK